MKNICFYISDHGYGHASRSIAIIRKLMSKNRIYVKTRYPLDFVKGSISSENVQFIAKKNDIGIIHKEKSLEVDWEKTRGGITDWVAGWETYIKEELAFCDEHKIDLIISDIAPQPFIIADALGAPSIGISNFTWDQFYSNTGLDEELYQIRDAYKAAELGCILPFDLDGMPFKKKKEVDLVSRDITKGKEEVKAEMNISSDTKLFYIGVGMSVDPVILDLKINNTGVFMFSSNSRLKGKDILRIPEDTESQNYISTADLVIVKAGYSTISEAIRARIPILAFERNGLPEDKKIVKIIEDLGVGKGITSEMLQNGISDYLKGIDYNSFNESYRHLPSRFKGDGTQDISRLIDDL